jgi:hypothetical protein
VKRAQGAGRIVALLGAASIGAICTIAPAQIRPADPGSKFTYEGGVANTRHNLTQRPIGGGAELMNPVRNDYGEVCVYCHTPHQASSALPAPLWNRTTRATTYTMPLSQASDGAAAQPGAASLACLSCHDGTVAIDSIINMPGPGRIDRAQERGQNDAFLSQAWRNPTGAAADTHAALDRTGCLSCHSPGSGRSAQDFTRALIGTDLRDDHPVGVPLPAARLGEFVRPDRSGDRLAFYDRNANGRPDPNEVRYYDAGAGAAVECASCHDPHGVPDGARGGRLLPKFLRVSTNGGALCVTCHVK